MLIKAAFKERGTFIPFIMAGDPTLEDTIQAVLSLAKAGADMIELGLPFSDPVADGPINQQAAERALQQAITMDKLFKAVQKIRVSGCEVPLIFFSYLNPILAYGYDHFAKNAVAAGFNGVLVVDLPLEEGENIYQGFRQAGLEIILLASPTTTAARLQRYQAFNPSFVYYISRLGVTGVQQSLMGDLSTELARLRQYLPSVKIAVGFGISTPEQAAVVSQMADGVIVGSALVSIFAEEGLAALSNLAKNFVDFINKRVSHEQGLSESTSFYQRREGVT